MGFLDFIPTVPDVLNFINCRIVGHDYEGGVCKTAGKRIVPTWLANISKLAGIIVQGIEWCKSALADIAMKKANKTSEGGDQRDEEKLVSGTDAPGPTRFKYLGMFKRPIPPKNPIEFWLIDEKEILLFRTISNTEQEALPIKGNHEMARFRCVDESILREWMPE